MPEQTYCHLSIRAEEVHDNGNGTFSIRFLGRQLSADEHRLIESLLPSRMDAFHKLLSEQMLLDAIASDSDLAKPSKRNK